MKGGVNERKVAKRRTTETKNDLHQLVVGRVTEARVGRTSGGGENHSNVAKLIGEKPGLLYSVSCWLNSLSATCSSLGFLIWARKSSRCFLSASLFRSACCFRFSAYICWLSWVTCSSGSPEWPSSSSLSAWSVSSSSLSTRATVAGVLSVACGTNFGRVVVLKLFITVRRAFFCMICVHTGQSSRDQGASATGLGHDPAQRSVAPESVFTTARPHANLLRIQRHI